ncbi:uncharacterized protein LOC116619805 [Nematostella vectensis]|uniref:uncharacterized protein LOC116619805 n=1 Tax=Nematostella vectensis TaxID=45351 RepID=UPI0020771BE7|nr:uncharacterized protein LOC116619805 [Nematostella vectensis]XP_048587572.1 uncharacterized protein LOC116619805 [Nematostella vectensis]
MAFDLRAEIEEIRRRGAVLGLNNEQINYAILKSLGGESSAATEEKPPKAKKRGLCLNICIAVFLILVLLVSTFFVVSVAASHNKEFGLALGQRFLEWQYPMVRIARFAALPLHKVFDLSEAYKWECIVNNPEYVPAGPDCQICEKAIRVPTRSSERLSAESFKKKYFNPGFSVIIANVSGYSDKDHTYEEFVNLYREYKEDMEKDACEIYDVKNITSLSKLLEGWNHYDPHGKIIAWKMCYGKGFRELRKMYPRPYFVQSEGALDKFMSLMQPAGQYPEGIEIPSASFENLWVAQVQGSSKIQLKPVEDCENCETFEIHLDQGNVLFFTQQVYRVFFSNAGQTPGILYASSFA